MAYQHRPYESRVDQDTKPLRAAGGVVYRNTPTGVELLLIRKRHGTWSLPKGHLKSGETEHEAAIREVEEETGVHGEVIDRIAQVSYTIFKNRTPRCKVVSYFLIRAQSDHIRPASDEQIVEVGWFPLKEASLLVERERLRRVVATAQAMLEHAP